MPTAGDLPAADRAPLLATAPNLRDVGGLRTADGARVRTGVLYRSGQLDGLADDDVRRLAELGVGTVVDLRSAPERAAAPDRLPRGVRVVVADALGDDAPAMPAMALLERLVETPSLVAQAVRDGHVARLFERVYRALVTRPAAHAAYRTLFETVAAADGAAVLYHCTAGKDRTGWATAALLLVLGVPREAVEEDFLASDALARAAFAPVVAAFEARGGDPDVLQPILGVVPAYLDAALDEVARSYGTVERWFADALGLGPATVARLRDRLLER